ncbi:MAG: two-component sensor histidine kinase [Clostridia bacterium]|nr:two-component sensor histidine kinase [Clostridia bacterium]
MKKKIMAGFVAVNVTSIIASVVLMAVLAIHVFESRVFDDLSAYAHLASGMIGEDGMPHEALVGGSLRITLITPDGAVAYDSVADSGAMGSHASRPEVEAALRDGEGRATRRSATMDKSTYYYALRLEDGSVLRAAQVASNIVSLYLRAVPLVLVMMAAMILLCVAASEALTDRLIAPIRRMTANLSGDSGAEGYPELEPFISRIRSQHEEILRSADMRVEFTANVSHELKTPLTSISGYAELIESGMAEGEQAKRFAGDIRRSASRLLTLINDIIRLSQMDSSVLEMNPETVDLAQIAEGAAETLRESAARMQVTLELDVRPALVCADRRMMEELAYNLCDNAIRYNVRGGSVRIGVHALRDQAILCVQDTGIGISKEYQEKIFERFYRVDKSRSKATGGTGLGLAIVKHIAARHHAQIRLESEPGVGTTIRVLFDRHAEIR